MNNAKITNPGLSLVKSARSAAEAKEPSSVLMHPVTKLMHDYIQNNIVKVNDPRDEIVDVLIIGRSKDGQSFVYGSNAGAYEANFLADRFKKYLQEKYY